MRKPPKHYTQICLACDNGGRRCSRHSRRVLGVNGNTGGVQVWETVDGHDTQVWDFYNEYVYIEYSPGLPSGGVISAAPSRAPGMPLSILETDACWHDALWVWVLNYPNSIHAKQPRASRAF